MKKRIVLCADDYGQAPAISQGIIKLIQQNRLSATSCLVNSPHWAEAATLLRQFQGGIDIGLHFNLTEGKALSSQYIQHYGQDFQSVSSVLAKAFLRKFDKKVVAAECHAQIDSFEQAMGFLPNYLDGHQHVHQFPVIREAVVEVFQQRLASHSAYVRLVNERLRFSDIFRDLKKVIIYFAGTRALKRQLDSYKIPYNQSFAGIYSFEISSQYPALFPVFLKQIQDGGMIMCHPGLQTTGASDVIADARWAEYQYLASDQFLGDCEAAGVSISVFSPRQMR